MSETTCERCTRPRRRKRLCRLHEDYERHQRQRRGELDLVPAGPVTTHIRTLRQRGWTVKRLQRTTRLSHKYLRELHNGRVTELPRHKRDTVLGIRPVWQPSIIPVSSVGAQRRVAALAYQGWTRRAIAEGTGVSYNVLNHLRGATIAARTAAAVAEFFDQHAYAPGPDPTYAKRARTQGAIPAAAWEEGTIDDPNAKPLPVWRTAPHAPRRNIDVDTVVAMHKRGYGFDEIATALGFKVESVRDAYNGRRRRATDEESAA